MKNGKGIFMLARKYIQDNDYQYIDEDVLRYQRAAKTMTFSKKSRIRTLARADEHNVNYSVRHYATIIIGTLAICVMCLIAQSSVIASHGYELVQVQEQITELQRENNYLRIENASMKSPARIRDIATKQFGMSVPNQVYFASEQKK